MASLHNSRTFQRINRSQRFYRAQWLKNKFVESPGEKVQCEEVKQALWSQFGELSLKEIGLIMRAAFVGVKRQKHTSGCKYLYLGIFRKPAIDTEHRTIIDNPTSADLALVQENEILKVQLQQTNQQQNHVQQELDQTMQELHTTKRRLVTQEHHLKRLREKNVLSASSVGNLKCSFTEIHSQFLSELPISNNKLYHLGSGAYGICSLKLYRNIEVSVKYLKDSSYQDLLAEATVIKVLEGHPNLPILLGISPKSTKEHYIVTKFHGKNQQAVTLWHVLRNKRHVIEEIYFKPICYEVARGLWHMHIKGFLHNDLKTDNVVIDFLNDKPSPVIIDFGKSCKISYWKRKCIPPKEQNEYSQRHRHIAPELIDGSHRQACTSDIYSFGILISNVAQYVKDNTVATAIAAVASRCTSRIPTDRPNMDTIVTDLK